MEQHYFNSTRKKLFTYQILQLPIKKIHILNIVIIYILFFIFSYYEMIQNIQKNHNIKMKPQTSSTSRNTAAKKTTIQPPEQKPTTGVAPSKSINLKQFKMQIDHQIAKCLDTLDRQGLKFLRETLRNSNIFDEEIQEVLEKQQVKNKINKKDGKGIKEAREQKQTKNNRKDKQKIENKQKNSSQDKKANKKDQNQKKSDQGNNYKQQIEEQIIQQYETFLDDKEDPSKQKTKLGPNPTAPLKQEKSIPLKLQKFQQNIQEPLKPFAKRTASRQGSRQQSRPAVQQPKRVEAKQKGMNTQKQQQHKQKKQIIKIVEKINQLPQEKLRKVGRFIQLLQQSQRIQEEQLAGLNYTKPYLFKQQQVITISNPSTMKSSTSKIKKNQKATSLYNSIIKGGKKNNEAQKCAEQDEPKVQLPEQQIAGQNHIDQQISQVEVQNQIIQPKIMQIHDKIMLKNQFQQPKQSLVLENQEQKGNQSPFKKTGSQLIKKGSFIKNFPITATANTKKPLDIQVTQSHQADTLQLNQGNSSKMVRLGKKKLGINKVKFVLLRNRGHPSIIGLTCIQLYNTMGKIIPITLENIKTPSPKLLKLFNGIHSTTSQQQMFTTVFKRDYQIQLEVPQKIGGLRIWNYNKSEIQNSKQTDWIELYINDKLSWEGLIKKGSYNEIVDYCTEAAIETGFDFEQVKKQGQNQKAILEQKSQGPSSSGEINIEGTSPNTISAKPRQNKVDWLQKTIMQQKLKKILEQTQEKQQQFQTKKSVTRLPNRFSQIYQQQQSNAFLSKQKFSSTQPQKKQEQYANKQSANQPIFNEKVTQISNKPQKQTNIVIQRGRSNSQKIDQQKDIFSSFGQSLIKQRMKANQINAKVNQITQNIDKLRDTYKKQQQLGYSSLINKQESTEIKQVKQAVKIEPKIQIKQKKNYQKQSLDDFMNDSLFQDDATKKYNKTKYSTQKQQKPKQPERNFAKKVDDIQKPTNNNKVDIDDFLNQLDDLVGAKQNRYQYGNQKQKSITIPELPKGSKLQVILISNWGDQQFIGLNKIQFFDSQGQRVFPSEAKSNAQNSAVVSIFSQKNGYITQQSSQWKSQKKQTIKLQLTFSKKIEFSLVRFWNYIGDRVHSMIGVRKVHIILEGGLIFSGDVRKNSGSSRDQIFKSCENILFTNNVMIQKRIVENDWLAQQIQNQMQETVLFKKTTENFMRPLTNGLNGKQLKFAQNKQAFKMPKRNCFQYDPPNMPCGYYIKLILHTTWGDRDFIGLNGIIIFDEKGNQITCLKKITQFPAPLITLSGYEDDKRILSNLFDGQNLTSKDQSIWLAPYLRDVDKMQKQAQNAILIQFDKLCTFSAINIYNYIKNPQRGVREIQVHVDNYLAYRGYVRMANYQTGQIMTTINFTKQPAILEKINYVGYNQDNLGQQVAFYNEGKPQKPLF